MTPHDARSVARAMMVKVKKYRAPHAILYREGELFIRRLTPDCRRSFPEWWNDHFRYTLVGVYDKNADLEAVVIDILDTHHGEYANPSCVKKAALAG